ncbi:MAG TPA: hypothetical protein VM101_09360 [Flavitalea sp.]|nr:hypothetical protein [Flavitalea sp.]
MWNLLVIAIKLNVFMLAGVVAFAFVLGYLVRTSMMNECKEKIFDLEKEMLRDNARILELEKEKAELLKKLNDPFKKS